MITKNFVAVLLGFLILQIWNVDINADDAKDAQPICTLGVNLEPFVPWAHDVANRTALSADDAVPLSKQLLKTCADIKDGRATQEEKSALAARLRSFGANSNSIMVDMRKMIDGGQKLINQFFVQADKLDGTKS